MERFQGIATKYLNNYLYWFYILEIMQDCRALQEIQRVAAQQQPDTHPGLVLRFQTLFELIGSV